MDTSAFGNKGSFDDSIQNRARRNTISAPQLA